VKDIELLNTLEVKIREMVSSLEREREKNSDSGKTVQESEKLSKIEERVRHLINMIDQMEQA
jgi:translation elongation factor EF-Tu-like GTPase